MKGLIRGVASAALVLGATACADDYSLDFGGAPTQVQTTPEVMFLASGAEKQMLVRLVNERNQSTPAQYEISNVGAGLTVTYDDQYRPEWTSKDTALVAPLVKEQQRYVVSANIPTGGQRTFDVTSGGLTSTVRVNVTPTAIALNGAPGGLMEEVTVTAPGFILQPDFGIVWGDTAAQVLSVAEDGSSAQVIFPANQTGPATIQNVSVSFLPTVTLAEIETAEPLNTAVTPYGGSSPTDNPAVINYTSGTLVFRDTWTNYGDATIVGGGQEKIWRLNIAEGGERTVSLDWNADAGHEDGDYDFAICNIAVTSCPIQRLTAAHPEIGTANLPAGEYYVVVVLFNDIHPAGVLTLTIE